MLVVPYFILNLTFDLHNPVVFILVPALLQIGDESWKKYTLSG